MFTKLNRKSAQTTVEYAILIAMVVGALVAMQVFLQRGLQGRMHDTIQHTGVGGSVGGSDFVFSGNAFEPTGITVAATTGQTVTSSDRVVSGGVVQRGSTVATTANRVETQAGN